MPGTLFAATYYVATTGDDGTGDGSSGSPWATISHGIDVMIGGDTLIVKDGTYSGVANFIGRNSVALDNGTEGAWTVIRAETPYGVRINRGSDTPGYWDAMAFLHDAKYVNVDGFIFDMNTAGENPEMTVTIQDSDHVKLTRCIVKRSGVANAYNEVVQISTSTYVLLEDVAAVGHMRYGFTVGGTADTSRYIIFRRCVGRFDYSTSTQPKATFAVYGNNSGYGVRDVSFQNILVIDGVDSITSPQAKYGGIYNPKNATGITYRGSIVLNEKAYYAGVFLSEQQGTDFTLTDTVIWDSGGVGLPGLRTGGTPGGITLNRATIGGNPIGYYQNSAGDNITSSNSLYYNNTTLATGNALTSETNDGFFPTAQAQGTAPVSTGIEGHQPTILRIEADSSLYGAGSDAGNIGATILYRWGTDNTLWGDAGWDTLSATALWPWPGEASIRSVFSESNDPPAGATPATNTTARGFAAAGVQLNGVDNITLTSYIWEYLGTQMPADLYGPDSTPSAFSFTNVTGANISTVTTSDNVTVTGIDNTTTLTLTGTGCTYSINGAAWATADDNVLLNDNVALRVTSSSSYSTAKTCTLNLGGVTDIFSVTTETAAEEPTTPRFRGASMTGGWR